MRHRRPSAPGQDLGCAPKEEELCDLLARHQVSLSEWKFEIKSLRIELDLRRTSEILRGWVDELQALLPAEWNGQPTPLPPIVLTFEPAAPSKLGHFKLGRNDLGLLNELCINPAAVVVHNNDPRFVASILLHELCHLWEQVADVKPSDPRTGYHQEPLRKILSAAGTPCTPWGRALPIKEGETPFNEWCNAHAIHGVVFPVKMPANLRWLRDRRTKETARRKLSREPKRVSYTCGCTRKVYVARRSDFVAVCQVCGQLFQRNTEVA